MNKGDNYHKDMNKDQRRDDAGNHSNDLRTRDVLSADGTHGAYRPRMNTIFNKGHDKQFKEGHGSETSADEHD